MNIVIINGSGKPRGQSTSESLARGLAQAMEAQAQMVQAKQCLEEGLSFRRLQEALAAADLAVVATPLYVDGLPYPLVRTLELLRDHPIETRPPLVGIVNCGFPEAKHCDLALRMIERFAIEADYPYRGGLALGGGEALHGKPVEKAGGMAHNIKDALLLAAKALLEGQAIPGEAIERMARPLLPPALFRLMGGLGWVRSAHAHGALMQLRRRPYDEPPPEWT